MPPDPVAWLDRSRGQAPTLQGAALGPELGGGLLAQVRGRQLFALADEGDLPALLAGGAQATLQLHAGTLRALDGHLAALLAAHGVRRGRAEGDRKREGDDDRENSGPHGAGVMPGAGREFNL